MPLSSEKTTKTTSEPARKKSLRPKKGGFCRMKFLIEWMNATRITYEMAAEQIGCTRQNFYHVINRLDDMKLSNIIKILNAYGYELELSYTRQEEDESGQGKILDATKVLSVDNMSFKRLSFIYMAIARYGITKHALAEKMGVKDSAFTYYDSREKGLGDIYFSRIIQIAECIDATLNVRVKRKSLKAPGVKSLHTSIIIENYEAF